jgi:hypothetical protein
MDTSHAYAAAPNRQSDPTRGHCMRVTEPPHLSASLGGELYAPVDAAKEQLPSREFGLEHALEYCAEATAGYHGARDSCQTYDNRGMLLYGVEQLAGQLDSVLGAVRPQDSKSRSSSQQDQIPFVQHLISSPQSLPKLRVQTHPPGSQGGGSINQAPVTTPTAAELHNARTGRNGAERKEWSPEEDEVIRQSVHAHGCRWRRIALQLPGRSDDAVRNRWTRLTETHVSSFGAHMVRGAGVGDQGVSKTVAAEIIDTVEGATKGDALCWSAPTTASTRRSQDGKEKPERVSWTKAEDDAILCSVREMGHKWNKIAERLPGRTDHAIRNRFHRLQTLFEDKQRHGNGTDAACLGPI